MRQVPICYAIIGNGRLANHIAFYLKTLQLKAVQWSRATHSDSELRPILEQASHIWILIRDDAIAPFIQEHLQDYLTSHILIHSSGSLTLTEAYGAHPLQTFSPTLYPAEQYPALPFFIDAQSPAFEALLPGLPNPHYRIEPHQKGLYHALCVMANNFTTLLWQKFFRTLQDEWGLKPQDAQHFLKQTCENLIQNPQNALTGPIARGDQETLKRNIDALKEDPYQAIFKAFVHVHCPQNKENPHG